MFVALNSYTHCSTKVGTHCTWVPNNMVWWTKEFRATKIFSTPQICGAQEFGLRAEILYKRPLVHWSGYFTLVYSFCWNVWSISVHCRNPYVHNAGEISASPIQYLARKTRRAWLPIFRPNRTRTSDGFSRHRQRHQAATNGLKVIQMATERVHDLFSEQNKTKCALLDIRFFAVRKTLFQGPPGPTKKTNHLGSGSEDRSINSFYTKAAKESLNVCFPRQFTDIALVPEAMPSFDCLENMLGKLADIYFPFKKLLVAHLRGPFQSVPTHSFSST